jgi:hypothetical protein
MDIKELDLEHTTMRRFPDAKPKTFLSTFALHQGLFTISENS